MKKTITIVILLFVIFSNAQIVNIPDINFKNALLNHNPVIDTNNDNEIQVTEASSYFGILNVANKNISNLIGIENFTSIYNLDCSENQLTNLDLTSNFSLSIINCANNQLTNFVFSNFSVFSDLSLDCSNNLLTNLDLSNLGFEGFSLLDVNCSNNELTSLNLDNSFFFSLNCSFNQLNSLNIDTAVFDSLDCSNNNLTSLVLTENTFSNEFSHLDCSFNNLTSLNLNNINLSEINCHHNALTNLNISNCTIHNLHCWNNNLTNLNLTNSWFNSVTCTYNNFVNISFDSSNTIELLNCSNNENLSNIDISNLNDLLWVKTNNCLELTNINLKNGNNENMTAHTLNLPNLETVCVDDVNSSFAETILNQVDHEINLTSDCGTLNTNQNTLTNYTIFPIPVKNKLTVQSKTNIVQIEIYNKLGMLILKQKNSNIIDVSSLELDIYYVKIQDENNLIASKKIIKQ